MMVASRSTVAIHCSGHRRPCSRTSARFTNPDLVGTRSLPDRKRPHLSRASTWPPQFSLRRGPAATTSAPPLEEDTPCPIISPKPLKIVATLSNHCVQHHEVFYHRRFVVTPVPLPNPDVFLYLGRQSQRAKGLHEQRHTHARTIAGIRWERAYEPFSTPPYCSLNPLGASKSSLPFDPRLGLKTSQVPFDVHTQPTAKFAQSVIERTAQGQQFRNP